MKGVFMPNHQRIQMERVTITCFVPYETPEQFVQALAGLSNLLEERTVLFGLSVGESDPRREPDNETIVSLRGICEDRSSN